jgi:GT2 family glycosyltransferase
MEQKVKTNSSFPSVVIVARNNLHLTKLAVDTALAQDTDQPPHVLVVNNASSDGTADWLRTKARVNWARMSTVTFPTQVSLSACWNYALRHLFSKRGLDRQHALVINNDVELRPDTYRLLLSCPELFVTAVSVNDQRQLNAPRPDGFDFACTERPHPDFSCFLIRQECWQRVGEFNEAYYPAYCEDCEYHVRMHQAGVKAVCIDVPFLHHGAQTIKHASPQDRAVIERGAQANRERFKKVYGCLPGTEQYNKLFQ